MLVEVRCDEFKDDGIVRPPIRFHPGLNVVLGTARGTNSIGKSTFLMILDFAKDLSICQQKQEQKNRHEGFYQNEAFLLQKVSPRK